MEGRQSVPTCLPCSYPLGAVFNPCGLWLHRLEALDPLLDRRVCIEEPIEKARRIPERGGDVERGGRFVCDLGRLLVGRAFLERAGQTTRGTTEQGTRGLGDGGA